MDSSSAFSELANRETADGCQEDIVTDLPPKKPGSKAQGRKRTKSGCLTCRQRRIKCGEEKPTCQNCAKSKRLCEGYNQRVVFKDPLSSVRPFASSRSASQSTSHGNKSQQSNTTVTILPIAPRPSARTTSHAESAAIQSSYPRAPPQPVDRQLPVFPAGNANTVEQSESGTSNDIQYFDHRIDDIDRSHVPNSERVSSSARPTHYDFNSLAKQETGEKEIVPAQENQLDWPAALTSGPQQFIPELLQHSHRSFPAIAPSIDKPYSSNQDWKNVAPTTFARPQLRVEQDGTTQQSALETDNHRWLDISQPPPKDQQEQTRISTSTTTQFPGEAPFYSDDFDMTDDEDDPFDVIDDDMNMEEESTATKWRENLHDDQRRRSDLSVVVALQAGQDNLRMRSFVDFIDRPDMLASYAPSIQSSPLRDPMTARIFCHFINATAPMMSMFERHPANPSLIFQGQTVPKSQQHIWTYTFPTLALRNTALLHAMLALACLHIAQLQKAPATTSWKHYSISLRRIGKALNSPSKRAEPATLAAALLLAFYECWGADHQKWTNHLLGAKHLIYQIDFAGISKYLKKKKQQQRQDERTLLQYHVQQHSGNHNFLEDRARLQNHVDDIDENIVGMLMGRRLRYDEYGQVLEDLGADDGSDKFYSEKDLEAYEIQRDLFWWYCKQDMFQSMLGGGKLFMSYHVWGRCPPRAPVGRLNATYGTYDHLVLLMGRVCDFAARDRKRKQATAKANGGWRPPGPHPPPPSGAPAAGGVPANQTPQPPPRMPQTPSFSGMLPISGQAQLPMGFEEYQESSPQSTSSDELDLEAQRIEAEEEWQEIRNMFSVLEDHFGDDFQALGPEFSAPIQTPFGPALQYRTYGIAGIWLTYYMGLIFCHRSHPAMPPVAMMAAGFAARQTGFMANQIGRIAAGLAPDCSMADQISPGVGAGLVESTMSLFIAGVQYQDPTQRIWTISRLRDIARLTGWQTALAILTGCEISWIKAFEAGRGPPYARTTGEPATSDIRDTGLRMTRDTHNRVPENRLVVKSTDRAYYALGVIAFEDDFGKLELAEEGEEHVEGIEDEEREEDQAGQET